MAKKILMILAPEGFRDEEYMEPKDVLKEDFEITTASTKTGELKGMLGGTANSDKTLDDISVEEFDAVVFVGGTGAKTYFSDKKALAIAREAFDKRKLVAAICISPTILANSGILSGRKATVYPDPELVQNLKDKGAEHSKDGVVRDGNVITAQGPKFARKFGEEIKSFLEEI